MSFTLGEPKDGESLGASKVPIRTNLDLIFNKFLVNHASINDANAGKHQALQMLQQSVAPITSATELGWYSKLLPGPGPLRLFMRQISSGTEIQMSGIDPLINANGGYTFLPGGLLMQWGNPSAASSGVPFTFPVPFLALMNLQITAQSANKTYGYGSANASGFTISFSPSSGGMAFSYLAIGTKA